MLTCAGHWARASLRESKLPHFSLFGRRVFDTSETPHKEAALSEETSNDSLGKP